MTNPDPDARRPFNLWALSDAHVGTDKTYGRESLAEALRQSESPTGFPWDVAVNLGDHSGNQGAPQDDEGQELVHQYRALVNHRREQIYDLGGNHDRSDVGEVEGRWFDTWVDPTGSHPEFSQIHNERRPAPVAGTWERYSFTVGNLLFLMMSDRNEPTHQLPRHIGGGNPGGVVSLETFNWWREQILAHPNHLVISAHHYVLKDTTVASGEWEGFVRSEDGSIQEVYHGYKPDGTPSGASYLYYVGGRRDCGAFEGFLDENPAASAFWLGGHTHSNPDDTTGGKSHIETRWGTHFVNVSALTKHHALPGMTPMSRLLTFTPESREVRIRCYLHTDEFAPQGFYDQAERVVSMERPFSWSSPSTPSL